MRGRGSECVQRAEVVGLGRTPEHVPPRGVAGELHVRRGGCAQQVGDELELLDGTRGLQEDSMLMYRLIDRVGKLS